jgi:hypothetical protein
MSAATTILGGCLAVSAVGAGALWHVLPGAEQHAQPTPILEVSVVEPMKYRTVPVSEPILYAADILPTVQDIEEAPLAQPIEERGDAMIFEMEALVLMPFDEAIILPFD